MTALDPRERPREARPDHDLRQIGFGCAAHDVARGRRSSSDEVQDQAHTRARDRKDDEDEVEGAHEKPMSFPP